MNKLNTSEYINVSKIASENSISLMRLKKMRHFKELRSYVEHFTRTPAIFKITHRATYLNPLLLPAVEEYIREVKNARLQGKMLYECDDYFLTEHEVHEKECQLARIENDEKKKNWEWKSKKVVCVLSGCGFYLIPV